MSKSGMMLRKLEALLFFPVIIGYMTTKITLLKIQRDVNDRIVKKSLSKTQDFSEKENFVFSCMKMRV